MSAVGRRFTVLLAGALVLTSCAAVIDPQKIRQNVHLGLLEITTAMCYALGPPESVKQADKLEKKMAARQRRPYEGMLEGLERAGREKYLKSVAENVGVPAEKLCTADAKECWRGVSCEALAKQHLRLDAVSAAAAWTLPVDRAAARKAFLHGCSQHGYRPGCAALVEYGLTEGEEETKRFTSLAHKLRTPAELEEEKKRLEPHAKAYTEASRKLDAEVEAGNERRREDGRRVLGQALGELSRGGQEIVARAQRGGSAGTANAQPPAPGAAAACQSCSSTCSAAKARCQAEKGGHFHCYCAMACECQCRLNAGGCGVSPAELQKCIQTNRDSAKQISPTGATCP